MRGWTTGLQWLVVSLVGKVASVKHTIRVNDLQHVFESTRSSRIVVGQYNHSQAITSLDTSIMRNLEVTFESYYMMGLHCKKMNEPHQALQWLEKLFFWFESAGDLKVDHIRTIGILVSSYKLYGNIQQYTIADDPNRAVDQVYGDLSKSIHAYEKVFAVGLTWITKDIHIKETLLSSVEDMIAACERTYQSKKLIPYIHAALRIDPHSIVLLGNLAVAYHRLRDIENAIHFMKQALYIQPHDSRLHHNLGNFYQQANLMEEAILHWNMAISLEPDSSIQSYCSLGNHVGMLNDMNQARHFYSLAIEKATKAMMQHKEYELSFRAQRDAAILQLIQASLPRIYLSREEMYDAREQYESQLDAISFAQKESNATASPQLYLPDPLITLGCGSMGYYLIYQGQNDLQLRQKFAEIYRKNVPTLSFQSPHVKAFRYHSIQSTLVDYHTLYPTISHRFEQQQQNSDKELKIHTVHRRLRIGFVSGFFYYHSVGLLMQHVISSLSSAEFEIFAFNFPHIDDQVTATIRKHVDHFIDLEHHLDQARSQIALHELDVLVYTEIGMHSYTYFLSFSSLALRTAVFWGHAITSGIRTIDYFVTSTLFQSNGLSSTERYLECLYRMKDLTTSFPHPLAETTTNDVHYSNIEENKLDPQQNRKLLFGIPSSCRGSIYLIPQTLYKLHVDFDEILQDILLRDPQGCAIFLEGQYSEYVAILLARFQARIKPAGILSRIVFAPKLNKMAFLQLCALADVVLDPFPVGGGRSSFEIFAVGTPIVMLYPRTSILQLTFGMYAKMDLYECVAYSNKQYAAIAVKIGTSPAYREQLSRQILARNHVLYNNKEIVVEEWKAFLIDITLNQPPPQDPDSGKRECPRDLDQVFGMQLSFDDDDKAEKRLYEIKAFQGDDPIQIGRAFAQNRGPLEPVKEHFIIRLLQKGVLRLEKQPLVASWIVHMDDYEYDSHPYTSTSSEIKVDIHYGDDLYLVAQWIQLKHHLTVHERQQLEYILETKHPEAQSREWIDARRHFSKFSKVHLSIKADESAVSHHRSHLLKERHSAPNLSQCSITLVVTTCKRLDLFRRMIRSLQQVLLQDIIHKVENNPSSWSSLICHVLVIDDNSTLADRLSMLQDYPDFEFVFKDQFHRGHAVSMQMAMEYVKTKYLMYIEDDWEYMVHLNSSSNFIQQALAIFRHEEKLQQETGHTARIAQILFNNQHGGWKQEHESLSYYVHEYASLHPEHHFRYWPGFSLNPGLWDLDLLKSVDSLSFDSQDALFERSFALSVYHAGLDVLYLPFEYFIHRGTEVSAYRLNGLPRPFDPPEV